MPGGHRYGHRDALPDDRPGTELRFTPSRCPAIRDVVDVLAVVDRVLSSVEAVIADPVHVRRLRSRFELDKADLEQVIRWVQEQILPTWGRRHPEPRDEDQHRLSDLSRANWRAWSAEDQKRRRTV